MCQNRPPPPKNNNNAKCGVPWQKPYYGAIHFPFDKRNMGLGLILDRALPSYIAHGAAG